MTRQKHLKDRIRARMQKTGEHYTVARRQILSKATPPASTGPDRFHLPGNVPATTALRVLLSAAGVRPDSGVNDWSEAMLFGIAGGVGAGVFAFRYEKEDFSSFFVAGRHLWQDDLAYLRMSCERLGVAAQVQETGGKKAAERQLREALGSGGPVVAWVDMASLPRHTAPQECVGFQYHVVTIYGIDEETSEAVIGDLADKPDRISLAALSEARARIKKQKNRLLRVTSDAATFDLEQAVRDGIIACHDALIGRGPVKLPGGKSMASNFTLDAFKRWGGRMHGGSDKQSWSKMFPPGEQLWRGLTSIYSFIQYGTGGGLSRPLYGQFFHEAHEALGLPGLKESGERYEQLGADWDALGEAAMPDEVEMFRRFKELRVERAELTLSGEGGAADRLADVIQELSRLAESAGDSFPLNAEECDALRANLQERIIRLHGDEVAAHELLGEFGGS